MQVRGETPGLNPGAAVETAGLEWGRCGRNVRCSGEMHRYRTERRLRRHLASPLLTLRHESAGIKQD